MSGAALAALVARFGLVMLFLPFSALDKILSFRGATAQASDVFRPPAFAGAVVAGGLAIEIILPLCILTGVADRAAALAMAGYCAATALLFKRFWEPPGFWKAGASPARDLFWDFTKNLSLGAGFLLITVGPDGRGLAPFLARPLASSHPYAGDLS